MGFIFISRDHEIASSMNLFNYSMAFPLCFLCLILSWQASSTSPPSPSPSPPTPISSASQTLRDSGYSLFAAAIDAAISDETHRIPIGNWNGTGTIFAPPDFAFSFTNAKFKNGRSSPRPTFSLLNFHSLRQTLKFNQLAVKLEGEAFLTFSPRKCIFKCKNLAGELCISGKKRHVGDYVRIRYPDLFVSENLVVHGVDGVLDPYDASECSDSDSFDPTVIPSSPILPRDLSTFSFLDHAIRTLRRRGYGVVATGMAIRRSDLMNLKGVTVFAPSDDSLFKSPKGFRYNFRYHVVPRQIRLSDLSRLIQGTEIETLIPGEMIVVRSVNGAVTVNGVEIDKLEIYHNGWIVLLSVSRSLHAESVTEDPVSSPISVIQDSGVISDEFSDSSIGRRNLSPSKAVDPVNNGAPSPDSADCDVTNTAPTIFSEYDEEDLTRTSPLSPVPSNFVSVPGIIRCPPASSPISDDGGISATSVGLEFHCPMTSQGSPNDDMAPSTL